MWLYVWIGVITLSLIIEFITTDMVCIWFVGGSIVSLILDLLNVTWYVQLIVFIVVSLVLLINFRKLVMKYLLKGGEDTNANAVIGKDFALIKGIGFNDPGRIKIGDVVWNVITKDPTAEIPKGTIVRIIEIKGNKYIVEEK